MTLVHIVDAFTDIPDTGNRAGVVMDASDLSAQEMQDIAKYTGYSETAFILPPVGEDHDLWVRYFTPSIEVPICGHATIATHFLRVQNGYMNEYPIRVKTGAGILPISIINQNDEQMVEMVQANATFSDEFDQAIRAELAAALNITSDDLCDLPVQIVSTGHSKVMVPMKSRDLMDQLMPDLDALADLSKKIACNGFFTFVIEGARHSPATFGRMFAPAIGIIEDPVTGNANGPAGAYLVKHDIVACDNEISYFGYQGIAMQKPGKMQITVSRKGDELSVKIAGQAVVAGTIEY